MTVKPIQQLGRRELHALLTSVAEAVLANKDNMTTTEMGEIRIMIHDLVNALEAIKDTFYPSPKWTQEQRREKLRALLATSVKAINATRDDMTEEELVSTRVWVQEALDDIRLEYGIAEDDTAEYRETRRKALESLIGGCAPEDLPSATMVMKIR
jgi:hypothetical protein